jgi:DNA-binding GntR family transcriptional regulator
MASEEGWSDIGAAHQSLHGAVMDSLRHAILQGQFKPGERLTESGLAKIFDVSRNPIREALRALEVEGFIEKHPRRGARVRLLTDEEASEIVEVRAELEGINARNAARRCNDENRKALQQLLREGNRALEEGNEANLQQLNQKFHGLLAEVGRNRYLADYIRSLRDRTLWLFSSVRDGRITESWREHASILEAVIAGDAELSALLAARHVRNVGQAVRSRLQSGPGLTFPRESA